MPSVDDDAEFELLDSIFAEIDEATLSSLTRGKATTPSKRNSNKHSSLASTPRQIPEYHAEKSHSQSERTPLGAVRNNNLVRQPPCQKVASRTPAARPHLTSTTTTTKSSASANTFRHTKSTNASLPFTKTAARPLQRPIPAAATKPNSIPVNKPKPDDELLADIDWSDDDVLLQPTKSQRSQKSVKGKERASSQQDDWQALAISRLRGDPNHVPFSKRFTRCVVLSVTEKVVKDFRREKTVILEVERSKECRRVLLFDEWATTHVDIGDTVNVIGDFVTKDKASPQASCSISGLEEDLPTCTMSYSSDNMFIVHPDTLISATRASDAHFCRRKAVLQEKVRSSSESSPALVYGNLLHELFQSCFLAMAEASDSSLEDKVAEVFGPQRRAVEIDRLLKVPKNIESLFTIHVELDEARTHLKDRSSTFAEFAKQYISRHPKPESFLSDPRTRNADPSSMPRLAISSVHDIEEDVWSPRLGLKGKIDASVQSILTGPPDPAWPGGKENELVMPFEIKTGRSTSVMQHRAQTMLYTQMMTDRYDRPIESGLLYYTQTNSLIRVEPVRNELRGLIIGRNDLARHLTSPPFGNANATMEIEADDSLGEISMAISPMSSPQAGIGGAIDSVVKTEEDELWADMEDLSGLECQSTAPQAVHSLLPPAIDDLKSCKKCYAAEACTLYRRAIEKVKFIASDEDPLQRNYEDRIGHLTDAQSEFFKSWENLISLEEREMLRFKKEIWTMSAQEREKHGRCFSNMVVDGNYAADRYISKATSSYRYTYRLKRSQEDYSKRPLTSGHMAVGDPIVISTEPSILALARGYILSLKADYIEVGLDHSLSCLPGGVAAPPNTVFRVDKDELQAGMGRIRENLAFLFYANGDYRRRALVVDLEKPRFNEPDYRPLSEVEKRFAKLNDDQYGAVDKVLRTQDYALILGMPGTGKTTTIAQIIKALVARGKSVLLTSYTHSAVDNILIKIKDFDMNILRLGQTNKVLPALAHLTLGAQETPTSIAQLEQRLFSPQVVATTALGIDHPIFSRRKFDYCIVDEASQITLPTCLGPLRYAERFILVGDHKQLPPLVKNPVARKQGLEISLFRRLSEAHPESMVYLRHQYRMNADIMAISNRLVYDNTLICGTPELANQNMKMSPLSGFCANLGTDCIPNSGGCWLADILDAKRNVVFVDTDAIPAREERIGRLVQNSAEAKLVHQTVEALLRCGVSEDQIGVIALYRQQIKLLQDVLQERKGIEILTADKSQGRDKDCIVMTLTRSNAEKHVGDLIRDWRRLNVSFTRSRFKLIIFGSRSTLDETPHMQKFFALVDESKWSYQIPATARIEHSFGPFQPSASCATLPQTTSGSSAETSQKRAALSPVSSLVRKRSVVVTAAGSATSVPPDEESSSATIPFLLNPEGRPTKIRKAASGVVKGEKRKSSPSSLVSMDRPILQDILNSQMVQTREL